MPALHVIDISDSDEEDLSLSQATAPPSSQLSAGDVIDLSDSDEVPASSSPPLARSPSLPQDVLDVESDSDGAISDDEFPVPGSQQFTALTTRPSGSRRTSGRRGDDLKTRDSGSSAGSKRTRDFADDSGSETDPPTPVKKPRRVPKVTEEQRRENETKKEAKRLERETTKLEKEAAKREREEERARKKAAAATEKRIQSEFKSANKLVLDRKQTLAETTIVVSKSLQKAWFNVVTELSERVGEHGGKVDVEDDPMSGYDTVRFRRHITKEYNVKESIWKPCDERDEWDQTAVLWLSAPKLAEHASNGTLVVLVDKFCESLKLRGIRRQAVILVHGMVRLPSATRGAADRALLAVEMAHDAYHMYAERPAEVVQRLYDMACDVGHRIHKYLERSHLPVHRLTKDHARAVVQAYPTMDSLYRAYEAEPQHGPHLLARLQVEFTADGRKRTRESFGPALSKRVHDVLYGEDPLKLVFKDND
ncbi:hypothetical protein BD626DRAFT_502714 [Schizophyllum amplum]|uniref:ERCC4 domain-containing protein n=1 Tax=Schizophyllum amplum TaxID=97359 RepID=A0A550C8I3_9AGAR|nr:hypothetical protein BD626DRAFT_502714 [Auriculariopsis ampla]